MRTIDVISPLDGKTIGSIDVADAKAVDAAVQRSAAAFESWSQVPVKERVQPLFRFKQLMEANMDELAQPLRNPRSCFPMRLAVL